MRRVIRTVKYFLLLLLLPFILSAQENENQTKAQKKAHKKEAQRKEAARKSEVKGKQRQYKIQDRKTRKRMKKHRKKVNNSYPNERPGFIKRLFGKKTPYGYVPSKKELELMAMGF